MAVSLNSYPNTNARRNTNYIARSAASSAMLGATIQGCYSLKCLHDYKKYAPSKETLSAAKKILSSNVLKAAGYSAALGAIVSGVFCLYHNIKAKIQNK